MKMKAIVLSPASRYEHPGDAVICRNRGASVPADERMRGAGGQTQIPTEDVPGDSAKKAAEQDPELPLRVDPLDIDEVRSDRLGHSRTQEGKGYKVKEGCPQDALEGSKHSRGDDRGDRVGGVVPTVSEVEYKRHSDDDDRESERRLHGLAARVISSLDPAHGGCPAGIP